MFFKKEVIGTDYLTRWHILPRNPYFNIYLHKFTGNDQRLPHCHPWDSFSVMLKGTAREYYVSGNYPDEVKHCNFALTPRLVVAGDATFRPAEYTHRIEVVDGPVWTLFFTFRRRRSWGFYGEKGFTFWKDALDDNGKLKDGL